MYRIILKYLLAVTIIFTLLVSGCGKSDQIKENEQIPEAAPSNSESNQVKSSENEELTEESDEDNGSLLKSLFGEDTIDKLKEIKWNKNIPDVFPEIKVGKCVVCEQIESDASVWVIYYVDITEKDIEDYNELLKQRGWEQVSSIEMDDISNYSYRKDEYAITATVAKDEKEGLVYGLFLEDGLVKEDLTDLGEIDEDYEEEQVDNTIVYEEQELPDDFPKGEIPLFEDGILTVASRISAEGELMFMLDYMSEKEFDDVSDDMIKIFKDQFGNNLNIAEMGEMTMITGESENYGFSVIIGKTDQADYPVNISYNVMSNEQ